MIGLEGRETDGLVYIYVIGPDRESPVKIGVASNPVGRLGNMQVAHWEQLFIHGLFTVYSRGDAFRVEKLCHRRLEDHAMRGEWFNVFAEDAVGTVTEILKEMRCGRQIKTARNIDNIDFIEKLENMGAV
jgi:hypothetical protein